MKNKVTIKIEENAPKSFSAPLNIVLSKLCGLRVATKCGDTETINHTQLGKLRQHQVNFTILKDTET